MPTTSPSFTAYLRRKADPLWREEQAHPFLTELGNGTLPLDKFRHYMRQDYVFLIEFCRVVALAAAKALDLDDMAWFAGLLHETLNTEMALHVGFCEDFGITKADLETTAPAPATVAYTSHMLAAARSGDALEAAMSILPCSWGYAEIGQLLAGKGMPVNQPLYARWIGTYASPDFAALADRLRSFVDRSVQGQPQARLDGLEAIFMESSHHEHRFWDSAYRMDA
ncbi:MAG: thiaminase II [Chloroflexi bacterium]|nr:thiaminase II [Chloroflexota bacterium]